MDLQGDWALLAAPAGLLIGGWAGLGGYSGWPVVVPMLLVVGGRPLHESFAASILVDWVNAVVAGGVYLWRGDVDRLTAGRWALVSLPLVLVGAGLSFSLLYRFEGLMSAGVGPIAIALGLALLVRAAKLRPEVELAVVAGGSATPVLEGDSHASLAPGTARALLRAGMSANALGIGFLGMGGAFNAAILLILLRGDETRSGVGTGLVFTALVLPVALLCYLLMLPEGTGVWSVLLPFAGFSALGAWLAAWQGGRIPSHYLGFVVGGCVLLAGAVASFQHWAMP